MMLGCHLIYNQYFTVSLFECTWMLFENIILDNNWAKLPSILIYIILYYIIYMYILLMYNQRTAKVLFVHS